MKTNIQFLINNAADLAELFLFCRIRMFAKDKGGRYTYFDFTKNERYNLLPKLEQRGWINSDTETIISHRKVCNLLDYTGLFVNISKKEIENKKRFKGFLLAVAETYVIRHRWLSLHGRLKEIDHRSKTLEKRLWAKENRVDSYYKKLLTPKRRSFEGVIQYVGRVFNSTLSEFLGITERSVTKWREYTKEFDYARYNYKQIDHHSAQDTTRGKLVTAAGYGGQNTRTRGLVTTDLIILTRLDVFSMNYFKGEGFWRFKEGIKL